MLKKTTLLAVSALLLTISNIATAQNNTNSPYSRYGYGELADASSTRSKSMGGAAFGLDSKTSVNSSNPASYTSIDSLTFLYEFGASAKQTIFSNGTSSLNTFTSNIDQIKIQFPLYNWLAASAGITPFSHVGYKFSNTDNTQLLNNDGTTSNILYTKEYDGAGGITQVYAGLSTKLSKNFAIGANFNYLFGNIEHSKSLINNSVSTSIFSPSIQTSTLNVKDLQIRYGLQYYEELNKNNKITLGLIFENKTNLGGSYQVLSTGIDTISKDNGSDFESPMMLGFGAAYDYKNKLTLAADVLFQNWADANYFGKKDSLKNRYKIAIGAEYHPNNYTKNYFNRMSYSLGANYTSGYWSIENNSPQNLGITFGLGLPTKGSKSTINLAFEYGRIVPPTGTDFKEEYYKMSISASFNERWFFKRRFE